MNLLNDPLLRVETPSGLEPMSLPRLLEALGQDQVLGFPGIQRHQEDAFYVFLCYLAGAILARAGRDDPVQREAFWRQGMRQLAEPFPDTAWSLVVEDLRQPAFLQPPLPGQDGQRLTRQALTPDELDLLPTAKNHDVKQARAGQAAPDEWVFALVSLQTMSGYFGRGNPGIARMNSGFGNRVIVEIVHDFRWGKRFAYALPRLLAHRDQVLQGPWNYDPGGLVLTWLEPWDGRSSLPLSRLAPFFLEVCRRIRLRPNPLTAYAVPSEANRVGAKDLKGIVGDAWIPLDKEGEPKALTLSPQGWTPEWLRRLLFAEDVELTPLQQPLSHVDGPLWLAASALVRGQGTTDGFHEARVLIPQPVRRRLFSNSALRASLQSLSRNAIEFAAKMRNSVLKPAVFCYLQGAPETLKFDDARTQAIWERFARRFDNSWSDAFFPWLWAVPEPVDEQAALREWAQKLKTFAQEVLREVEAAMPSHTGRAFRAITAAERFFWYRLYDSFSFLKEVQHAAT